MTAADLTAAIAALDAYLDAPLGHLRAIRTALADVHIPAGFVQVDESSFMQGHGRAIRVEQWHGTHRSAKYYVAPAVPR